jgi:hypothetical protein
VRVNTEYSNQKEIVANEVESVEAAKRLIPETHAQNAENEKEIEATAGLVRAKESEVTVAETAHKAAKSKVDNANAGVADDNCEVRFLLMLIVVMVFW